MDLGEPDGVETHGLGSPHLAERFVEGRRVADPRWTRKLREQTEFHSSPPLKFGIFYG